MKRCPQCGAEYDDYVQYCFVDGAELAEAAVGPPPAAAKRATPVPAPAALPPRPTGAPPARPVQESSRGLSIWALAFLFMLVITLFGFGGVVGALFLIGGSGPTAQPVEAPRPAPLPPPDPAPAPVAANIIPVRFESDPTGAVVWEEEKVLCITPCDVEHPDYAPAERRFVLKAEGHTDTTYVMSDPSEVQRVTLTRSGRTTTRPPRPTRGEDILIQR